MFRRGIPIGRIFRISIDLDYSWFLIVALLAWMLADSYFPSEFPNWTAGEYWLMGVVTALMLFVSVLVHELAHSVAAQHFGIPVPRITLFLFGGVSQIADEPPAPGIEFWIAIVGPVASLAVAVFCWEVEPLLLSVSPLFALAKYLALLNLILAVFNLIPGFPLDGGRILRALLWRTTHSYHRATVAAGMTGRFFGFVLIFFGVWQALMGNLSGGIWTAIIGWFLESAAGSQLQQESLRSLLDGHRVMEAMQRDYMQIAAEMSVQDLVGRGFLLSNSRFAIVAQDDMPVGMVTLAGIRDVPSQAWATTPVTQVMVPLEQLTTTRANAVLWSALEKMGRRGVNQLPVVDGDGIVGVLSREDILHYLTGLRALQPNQY